MRPLHLQRALRIAAEAHRGQVDKVGLPYMLHPLMVAELVAHHGYEYEAAALLHDVLEDTSVTVRDLLAAGMPFSVVRAVKALTHKTKPWPNHPGGESRLWYLNRVKANKIALVVKTQGDHSHNLDERRLAQLPPEKAERLRVKYAKDKAILLKGEP